MSLVAGAGVVVGIATGRVAAAVGIGIVRVAIVAIGKIAVAGGKRGLR